VEGINIGGILLLYVSLFVFGMGLLVAAGFWLRDTSLGRRPRAALLTFATGQLLSALVAVVAALSFLGPEFHHEGENTGPILLIATILLLTGSGQFIAAIRCPWNYGAVFACGVGAIFFLAGSFGDSVGLAMHFQSRPEISLLLAPACMVIALLPPRRRTNPLLWAALGALGVIAGWAIGDLMVATRSRQLAPPEHANVAQVRVEIWVLGMPVSEETGLVPVPDAGPGAIRFLTLGQAVLLYTTRIAFAAGGLWVALACTARLIRQAAQTVPTIPVLSEDFPPIHGYSSEQIKRM
jgi:hypothetical protein